MRRSTSIQLSLNIDASVATLYGNVGVTDRVEVGFAAPFVALQVDGSRVNTYRGRTFTQATASARATGLADLVVRTKYTLFDEDASGLAAAVDVRLPTGRRRGSARVGFSGAEVLGHRLDRPWTRIGARECRRERRRAQPRRSATARAVTYAATGRVSVIGELLGRWLDSPGHIVPVSAPHPRLNGVETVRLTPGASSLHILTVVPGFKWNLTDTWVLAGNVTVPLTRGGLTAPFTPFIGMDYALGR